jgi:hypothetical protein
MKIFKGFSITILLLLLQRHNMTKTRNKIPANISDFTVLGFLPIFQKLFGKGSGVEPGPWENF